MNAMPEQYKTEEQLKREARAQKEQEAAAARKTPKSDGQKKWENFWYHYKWHAVAAVSVLILGVFFVNDVVFRAVPDLTVVMVTGEYYEQEKLDSLARVMGEAAGDYNGDGKVLANVDFILIPGDQDTQDYAYAMKLTTVLAAGADPVYLLDEKGLADLTEKSGGAPFFGALTAPASALGINGVEGLRFYIREKEAFVKKQAYYGYCENFLKTLNGG